MSVFMMNFGLMPLGVLPAGLAADVIGGKGRYGNSRNWADSRRGLYPRDPEKVTGAELAKKRGVRSCEEV